jgi:AAA domain-containing protein
MSDPARADPWDADDPEGWREFAPVEEDGPEASRPTTITATPYKCREPAELPRRPWIYGRQLLRGSLSVIIAPGAVGKTALLIGTALALVTGRSLFGKTAWDGAKRVWIWNLEDSELELTYLIEAARLHWGIDADAIGDRLFVDSALSGAELCLATEDNAGFRINEPVVEALVEELERREVDVLMVDPFVSSHRVSENNNTAIDAIAKKWARVAVRANCAVLLVHHTRKQSRPGDEANAEAGRGASALPNAARSVVALNRMTDEEARSWGIEGQSRRRYFRAYDDKPNRAPSAAASDWYHLASVDLGNGDNIQVVLPWTPPDAFTGVTTDHLMRVQDAIARTNWRASIQAANWAGNAVAEVLDLDLEDESARRRVKDLLKAWIASGALTVEKVKDTKGREQPHIKVGNWAQPEAPTP